MGNSINGNTAIDASTSGRDLIHLLNESVDPATGSVNLSLSLPTPPSRGLTLPFSIQYSSGGVYSPDEPTVTGGIQWRPATGILSRGGWVYAFPQGTYTSSTYTQTYTSGQTTCDMATNYVFVGADGSNHNLGLAYSIDKGNINRTNICPNSGQAYIAGGDGQVTAAYVLNASAHAPYQPLAASYTVTDGAGTIYSFGGAGIRGEGVAQKIEDRNGNIIWANYTPDTQNQHASLSATDTSGRQLLNLALDYTPGSTNNQTIGANSYGVTWTSANAAYSPSNVRTSAAPPSGISCPTSIPSLSGTQPEIHSISLPSGLSYTFYYGADNPDSSLSNPYGLLSEIIYPNGGWVKYRWKESDTYSTFGNFAGYSAGCVPGATSSGTTGCSIYYRPIPNECYFHYSTPVVAERIVSFDGTNVALDQTFTYSTTFNGSLDWTSKTTQVTSTDEVRNTTSLTKTTYAPVMLAKQPFDSSFIAPQAALESQIQVFDARSSTVPIQTTNEQWWGRFFLKEKDITNAANLTSKQTFDYAQTGSGVGTYHISVPAEEDDYDFGATSPTRKRITKYAAIGVAQNIPAPCQILNEAGDGTVISEIDNYFDGSTSLCGAVTSGQATVAVSGLPSGTHDETNYGASSNTPRGNITMTQAVSSGGANSITKFSYDETGQRISMTDPCGNGNCSDMSSDGGHTTTYSYADSPSGANPSGNSNSYLTSTVEPSVGGVVHSTSSTYNYTTGERASETDQNGRSTHFYYNDPLLRMTETDRADGGFTKYTYSDVVGQAKVTATTLLNSGGTTTQTVTSMDGLGQVVRTSLTTDPGGPVNVDYSFDGNGRLYQQYSPYRSSQNGYTTYLYDALNRPIKTILPDGSSTSHCYEGIGSSVQLNCSPNASTLSGDTWVDETDERGIHKQLISDGLGRLAAVIEPSPSGGVLGAETDYNYDANDNLTGVIQRGVAGETSRIRSFSYDSLNRLTCASNPEASSSQCPANSGVTLFGYDANGNMSTKTDAGGNTLSYTYDALNRTLSKARLGGSSDLFYYDGQVGQYAMSSLVGTDVVGRLSFTRSYNPDLAGSNCNPAGRKQCDDQYFGYDSDGNLDHVAEASPSEWGVASHSTDAKYDLAGNITDLSYPDGSSITQSFDGADRLASVSSGTTAQPGNPFISGITYLPSGVPQSITYGNGVIQTLQQNSRLQPCRQTATSGSLTLMDRQYFYNTNDTTSPCGNESNNNGNIWHIVDGLSSATGNQNFQYDSLNRLTSFEGPNMSGAYRSQSFTYDSFGNISATKSYNNVPSGSANVVGTPSARMFANPNFGASSGWPYDVNNHLLDATFDCTSPTGSHYDAAGNIQCDGSNTDLNARQYTWDAESRITRVSAQQMGNSYNPVAGYTYDVNGNRIRADQLDTSGNTTSFREYSFFNGMMLAEKDQNGVWTNYIYANGQKIAKSASAEPVVHFQGTRSSSDILAYGMEGPLAGSAGAGLVIASGDKLSVDFMQNLPSNGGLALIFDNGTYGAGDLTDIATGTPLWLNNQTGSWQHLVASLQSYVGHTLSYAYAGFHNSMPTGTFDMEYANIVIQHADGSITPVYTGQAGVSVQIIADGAAHDVSSGTASTVVPAAQGTHYFLADHLGTTQMELSPGGWPIWQGQFAPFGQELDTQNTAMRYKFTGKERDAESGLDLMGARNYGSSMGRWMSPDSVNVTEDRMLNPSSTLNKYAYGSNNPLKYTDPDGKDITIFYEPGNPISGSPGHTMLLAYNQQTGDSAIRSFGPDYAAGADKGKVAAGIPSPGTDSFGFENINSVDDLRANFASMTIQTTPEEAQAVINQIRTNPDGKYTTFWNNCTTTCSKLLRSIGKTKSHALYPGSFFDALMDQYGHRHSTGKAMQMTYTVGHLYGSPRPGYNPYALFFSDIHCRTVTTNMYDSNGKSVHASSKTKCN